MRERRPESAAEGAESAALTMVVGWRTGGPWSGGLRRSVPQCATRTQQEDVLERGMPQQPFLGRKAPLDLRAHHAAFTVVHVQAIFRLLDAPARSLHELAHFSRGVPQLHDLAPGLRRHDSRRRSLEED